MFSVGISVERVELDLPIDHRCPTSSIFRVSVYLENSFLLGLEECNLS